MRAEQLKRDCEAWNKQEEARRPRAPGAANLAALFNRMTGQGATEFAKLLNNATPDQAEQLGQRLSTATPDEVKQLAEDLNTGKGQPEMKKNTRPDEAERFLVEEETRAPDGRSLSELSVNESLALCRELLDKGWAQVEEADQLAQRLAAATSGAGGDEVPELVNLLHGFGRGWQARAAAAKRLGQIGGDRAVKALIDALFTTTDAGHWEANAAAARALGELGDPSSIKPLILAHAQWNTAIHRAAQEALNKIDPAWARSGAARLAVPELIARLQQPNWLDWTATVKVLGEIGDSRAVEQLITMLQNSGAWTVREDDRRKLKQAVATALVQITGQDHGEDADPWLRWHKQQRPGLAAGEAKAAVRRFEEALDRYVSACDEWQKILDSASASGQWAQMAAASSKAEETCKQAEQQCVQATRNLRNVKDRSLVVPLLEKAAQHPSVQREGQMIDHETVLSAVQETLRFVNT